jgi:GNAT superfamily N-acetyltransferase
MYHTLRTTYNTETEQLRSTHKVDDEIILSPGHGDFSHLTRFASAPLQDDIKSDVMHLTRHIEQMMPGVHALLDSPDPIQRTVRILRIFVPEHMRRRGIATIIMQEIQRAADQQGWTLQLVPSTRFGTPLSVLVPFYQKFGFAYSLRDPHMMTRYPHAFPSMPINVA